LEDYWARNEDDTRPKKHSGSQAKASEERGTGAAPSQHQGIGEDSVPLLGELALNRLAGRSQVCRVPLSFDAATGGLCTSDL
jgi:hypothetical protein